MPIVLAPATGTSVGNIVDRVYRDFIHAPDDQPLVVTLAADVDATTSSWTYDDDTVAPDEEELLASGVIVECGTEQARITAVDYDANTLTVTRGVNGTAKASHTSGDDVRVAPLVSRHSVVEAVKDEVVALYPNLWHEATYELTTATSYVEVPAEVIDLHGFVYQDGDQWLPGPDPVLMRQFTPSSTTKAVRFRNVPADRTGHLTYRAKFSRPDNEDADLGELGVEPQWERIVAAGAAAQSVAGRPQDILSVEYITEQLEREAAPPGTAADARNGLLTLRRIWLSDAAKSLRGEQGVGVSYNRSALRR